METNKWIQSGGKWYYLNAYGAAEQGWLTLAGNTYHFTQDGEMEVGWHYISGYWYYFNSSGVMQIGWQKLDDYWYYLGTNGQMYSNCVIDWGTQHFTINKSGQVYLGMLSINREQQEQSNWCWAACAMMIGNYGRSYKMTQSQIVNAVIGKVINEPVDGYGVINALNYSSMGSRQFNGTVNIGYRTCVDYIDNNKPMSVGVSFYGFGHLMVISGYNRNSTMLYCIDPASEMGTTFYHYSHLAGHLFFY